MTEGKNKDNNIDITLTADQVKSYLVTLKDSDLSSHYIYKELITCTSKDATEVKNFIKNNKPIVMTIKDGELYYKLADGMEKDELFTVDTENSFSESNKWLYDKIINVELIYPNISSSNISSEMVSFFICLLIAAVLGDEFEDEFIEVVDTYDFKNWIQGRDGEFDFITFS